MISRFQGTVAAFILLLSPTVAQAAWEPVCELNDAPPVLETDSCEYRVVQNNNPNFELQLRTNRVNVDRVLGRDVSQRLHFPLIDFDVYNLYSQGIISYSALYTYSIRREQLGRIEDLGIEVNTGRRVTDFNEPIATLYFVFRLQTEGFPSQTFRLPLNAKYLSLQAKCER